MKRDLNTRELALYLNTTVEEIRRTRADAEPTEGLVAKTADAPVSEEDSNAWYCRNRTDGTQYCLELNSQRICTLQAKCISQRDNGTKAKLCGYKKR